MAFLNWREPNKAKWIGIRPGHNGTPVLKGASVVNGTAIIHTVTAGKTLYLAEWVTIASGAGAGQVYLLIRNTSDVLVRYLGDISLNSPTSAYSAHGNSFPPIEVPAGYDICAFSSAGTTTCRGGIWGWEE